MLQVCSVVGTYGAESCLVSAVARKDSSLKHASMWAAGFKSPAIELQI